MKSRGGRKRLRQYLTIRFKALKSERGRVAPEPTKRWQRGRDHWHCSIWLHLKSKDRTKVSF